MPAIPLATALLLAAHNVPQVASGTLIAFAVLESGLNPLAIHDNTAKRSYQPGTAAEAVALATSLLAQNHSLDLGIMQVNSTNLPSVGLSVANAFDVARSMRAGANMLVAAYLRCNGGAAQTRDNRAAALKCASSVYNTGSVTGGFVNGYTPRLVKLAAQVVPSIRDLLPDRSDAGTDMPAVIAASRPAAPSAPRAPPNRSPTAWDVFAASGGIQFVFSQRSNNAR